MWRAIVCSAGVSVLGILGWYALPVPTPVLGTPLEYGMFSGGCGAKENATSNGAGTVAILRQVECLGGTVIDPAWRDYFVFVHDANDWNKRSNVVLAYREWVDDDPDYNIAPRLVWVTPSMLKVVTGRPAFVTVERDRAGSVRILHVVNLREKPIPNNYRPKSEPGWTMFP